MSRISFTIDGYVSSEIDIRTTNSNKRVCTVSVPHQRSKFNEETKKYDPQGETLWVKASFWEDDVDVIAAALTKGTQVIITAAGAHIETYEKQDGTTGANLVLEFATVAVVQRARKKGGGGYTPDERFAPGAGGDVWNTPGSEPGWAQQAPDDSGWVPPSAPTDDETPF